MKFEYEILSFYKNFNFIKFFKLQIFSSLIMLI